jgi:hypothetical protein
MEYQPLDITNNEIRILKIFPDDVAPNGTPQPPGTTLQHSMVHCALSNVSLNHYTPASFKVLDTANLQTLNRNSYWHLMNADALPACDVNSVRWDWGDFVALSYTWGPPTPVREIVVNGVVIEVRENLADFLQEMKALSTAQPGVYLWIDALCS